MIRGLDHGREGVGGILKRGVKVVIHGYSDRLPNHAKNPHGKGPYEVHFYPGVKKVAVLGRGGR